MKTKSILIMGVLAIMMAGCGNDEAEETPQGSNIHYDLPLVEQISRLSDYTLTDAQAVGILKDFVEAIGSPASTICDGPNDIQRTKEILVRPKTRMPGPVTEDIPIYKIPLRDGDRSGFALVSGDIRNAKVIAYIPDTLSAGEVGLRAITDDIIRYSIQVNLKKIERFISIQDSLGKARHPESSKTWITVSDILRTLPAVETESSARQYPLMRTEWSQKYPYNCKLPQGCDSNENGRMAAGSDMITIAQILTHYEPLMAINGSYVDWKLLKKSRQITSSDGKQLLNEVGHLVKWAGEKAHVTYDCDYTRTDDDALEKILDTVDMTCDESSSWDLDAVYQSLGQGRLVHASIRITPVYRRPWVLDGYITAKYAGYPDERYLHYNWGEGGSYNGYYEADEETPIRDGAFRDLKIRTNIRKR